MFPPAELIDPSSTRKTKPRTCGDYFSTVSLMPLLRNRFLPAGVKPEGRCPRGPRMYRLSSLFINKVREYSWASMLSLHKVSVGIATFPVCGVKWKCVAAGGIGETPRFRLLRPRSTKSAKAARDRREVPFRTGTSVSGPSRRVEKNCRFIPLQGSRSLPSERGMHRRGSSPRVSRYLRMQPAWRFRGIDACILECRPRRMRTRGSAGTFEFLGAWLGVKGRSPKILPFEF